MNETIEIDGQTWHHNDLMGDAAGGIWQLKNYATSSNFWANSPAHERWYWTTFDTEYNWSALPDPSRPRPSDEGAPCPPFRKMQLVPQDSPEPVRPQS
jgi:hypothetical protein